MANKTRDDNPYQPPSFQTSREMQAEIMCLVEFWLPFPPWMA